MDRRGFLAAGATTVAVPATTGFAGASAAQEVEELTIIMENVFDTTVVEELLPRFEEDRDFSVTIEAFPYGTMNERITTQLRSSASTYDVMVIDNPWVGNFVRGELLQPLDDRIDDSGTVSRDVYMDSLWNTVGAVDGTAYMLPFYNYALSMLYRQDVADDPELEESYQSEFGGELAVPSEGLELATYLDQCRHVTRDTTGDGETDFYGAAMQAQRGYKIAEEWTNYLYAEGGAILDEGEVVLDRDDSAVRALEMYAQNLDEAAPPAARSWGFNEARQLMQNGDAYSMITYNWMLGRLSDTQVGDDLAVAEVPGSKAVLGAWGWAIPHNVESQARADAAWEFLSWVESPEIRKERALRGGSPTGADTLEDSELLDQFPDYYPTLQNILEDAEPLPSVVGGNQMIQALGTNLSQAVTGEKSPEGAISDAAAELEQINQSN